jgi:hypothetical protein
MVVRGKCQRSEEEQRRWVRVKCEGVCLCVRVRVRSRSYGGRMYGVRIRSHVCALRACLQAVGDYRRTRTRVQWPDRVRACDVDERERVSV